MTFAELIKQIDYWDYPITLFVMMQFEAVEQIQRDVKKVQTSLDEYDEDDRQWTVIHMQLTKKQALLKDNCWCALATAYDELQFAKTHDGKGLCEWAEASWTMTDASQFATLRQKWMPYVKKAREMNRGE